MKVELISISPDAERLIERAARTCYQSMGNAKEGSAEDLLPRLLKSGHETPFEHASASFLISGCSRAMTHQLVRHRLMSVSQKSQRYVGEDEFEYVLPPAVPAGDRAEFDADMAAIRAMYRKWLDRGLRKEDARYVLPGACTTEIVITANFREFRHIFKLRCSPRAQWEIREVCLEMLRVLGTRAPSVFGDLVREFIGA
jgi:thymidylate synthase (FAD)